MFNKKISTEIYLILRNFKQKNVLVQIITHRCIALSPCHFPRSTGIKKFQLFFLLPFPELRLYVKISLYLPLAQYRLFGIFCFIVLLVLTFNFLEKYVYVCKHNLQWRNNEFVEIFPLRWGSFIWVWINVEN